MTIDEIKMVLAEVSRMCAGLKCCKCPLHKTEGAVYCPLNIEGDAVNDPDNWDVSDWEDANETD